MSVWAFACKLESSLNRWFDGTDQDISFSGEANYTFEKNTDDPVEVLESNRKAYEKYVSQMKTAIGSMLFNAVQFNEFSRKLGDFSNAFTMEDDVEIQLSRTIVRVDEIIYPIEYFNKEMSFRNADDFSLNDDSFLLQNGNDARATDSADVSDVSLAQMIKTVPYTADDSISFTEDFSARIGGKSFADNVMLDEIFSKNIDNVIGDESRANPIGMMMFNESMFNEQSDEASIVTAFGITEEVQIILTT